MDISNEQIEDYFHSIRSYLLAQENIFTTDEIKKQIKKDIGGGVYFVFDDIQLCYVGESGSLFGRLKDFSRTLNHTFRRSLGEHKYLDHPKYFKASSKIKFHDEIESLLDEYIQDKIKISYKSISIGRKEFEDWMQETDFETKFLNKRKKRK